MSAIDLLLSNSIDFERTHQVVLYTLFQESDLASHLLNMGKSVAVEWEAEKQLFDLGVSDGKTRVLMELKMWSSLSGGQLARQTARLKGFKNAGEDVIGRHLLLGTSWFEWEPDVLLEKSDNCSRRLGYEELIRALDSLILSHGLGSDIGELASPYRDLLVKQFDKIKNAADDPDEQKEKGARYYYSLFWKLKNQLEGKGLERGKIWIHTATNAGGPVYILTDREWVAFQYKGMDVSLYYEVVNDWPCIKFTVEDPENPSSSETAPLREAIRSAVRKVLEPEYGLINIGRYGKYMSACQLDINVGDVHTLDESAQVLLALHEALPLIAKEATTL